MGSLISALRGDGSRSDKQKKPQTQSQEEGIDQEEVEMDRELADLNATIENLPQEEAELEAEMTRLQAELDAAADLLAQAQELADDAKTAAERDAQLAEIERRESVLAIAQANKEQADQDLLDEKNIQENVQNQAGESQSFADWLTEMMKPPPTEAEIAAQKQKEARAEQDAFDAEVARLYTIPQFSAKKAINESFFKRERAKRAYILEKKSQIWRARTGMRPITGYTWYDKRKFYHSDRVRDMTDQWPKPVLGDKLNPDQMIPFVFEGDTYQFRQDADFRVENAQVPPCGAFNKNSDGAPRVCREGGGDDDYKWAKSGDRSFLPCKPGYWFQEHPVSELSKCVYMGWRYADVGTSYYAESRPVEFFIEY